MQKFAAGLLAYRWIDEGIEVMLVHPGGPFWRRKDAGAWSIPKGEIEPNEDALAAAEREFREETGFEPQGPYLELSKVKLKSGKTIHCYAFEGDFEVAAVKSNTFQLEWPPRSGKLSEFPEIDRAEYFSAGVAKQKLNAAQAALVDELLVRVQRQP